MKKKNGFVFLESVISLVVVALALTAFLKSYTTLATISKQNEVYDNISDKYLLYSIANLGAKGSNRLNSICVITRGNVDYGFGASKEGIWSLGQNSLQRNQSCWTDNFFTAEKDASGNVKSAEEVRKEMFDDTGLVYFYYIKNLNSDIYGVDATKIMDNGALQYVQTLSKDKEYFVGVFRRSGRYFFASVVVNEKDS